MDEISGWVRVLLVIAGVGGFVAGIVAIFFDRDGAATAALITVGMGMIALGLLAPNMDSFKAGGVEIELRETVEHAAAVVDDARSKIDEITYALAHARKVELEITHAIYAQAFGSDRAAVLDREILKLDELLTDASAASNSSP